jgi:hypothetical protein
MYGWATLPIMALLSFLLAGVENVGAWVKATRFCRVVAALL